MNSGTLSMAATAAFCSLVVPAATAQADLATWGSFDSSRIAYTGGVLTTGDGYDEFRTIIMANNGTLVSPTSTLTASYLNGIDVFYTSLLHDSNGTLSGAEQTALHDWISAGGTLIVTADIVALNGYNTFTSSYGVTNYQSQGLFSVPDGNAIATHPITENVNFYRGGSYSTFTFGQDALALFQDVGDSSTFMVVLEPGSGFNGGGRILVMGDHNILTDSFIDEIGANNRILANNIAAWAASSSVPEPRGLMLMAFAAFA
ncbi:MAG: DUF4350 domain-containing protein, partial [Planctomycetaceae bacterium]